MKIEVVSKSADISLGGTREVWVRVFANEVHDWRSIESKLGGHQRAMLNDLGAKRRMSYFPHNPDSDEREEHGYIVEDFWVWAADK